MADIKALGNGDLSWNGRQYHDYFEIERFIATASVTLKSLRIYASGGTGNAKVAIYSDNAGAANALLASGSGACAVGWTTINISDVAIVKDTYYWLAHIVDFDWVQARTSGGTSKYKSATYSSFSFPDPAGTGFSNDGYTYAMAGWGAEAVSGAVIPILMSQYRRRVA